MAKPRRRPLARGAGDLTMERLATLSRADLFTEVFVRRLGLHKAASRA